MIGSGLVSETAPETRLPTSLMLWRVIEPLQDRMSSGDSLSAPSRVIGAAFGRAAVVQDDVGQILSRAKDDGVRARMSTLAGDLTGYLGYVDPAVDLIL